MQLEKGILRMGKIMPNFFVAAKDPSKPPPDMKQYFHKNCLFEMLFKARPTTKVIDDTEEIEGFEDLSTEDQDDLKKLVDELVEKRSKDGPAEPKKTPAKKKTDEEKVAVSETPSRKRKNEEPAKGKRPTEFNEESDFNSFYKFVKVCTVLKDISSKTEKAAAITSLLQKKGFDGDLMLWLTFLIRESDKRNYNVSDETLIASFAKILDIDQAKIQKYVTKSNDVAMSIAHAHEKKVTNEKSNWSLQKVDRYLEKLEKLEDDAVLSHLKFAAKRFRHDELEVLIRLIRKELDTGADASVILKGVHSKAPSVFEADGLDKVVDKYYNNDFEEPKKASISKKVEEPKAKKSRRQHDSDDSDDEESEDEMSDSEPEDEHGSDSESGEEGEDNISGSDSDDVSEISSDDEDGSPKKENSPKKLAKGTRTRPRGNDGNIKKKEECPPDMEPCRYGVKCYRKNKDHQEEYWHPSH